MSACSIKRDYSLKYVAVTYLVFWLGILLIGAVYLLSNNDIVMTLGSILLSWTPTVVLLIMFNKLLPNSNRKAWIKKAFSARINVGIVIATALAFTLPVVFAYIIMLFRNGNATTTDISALSIGSITASIISSIITGATGEELGWRGYLQRHFEERSNGKVIKSALKVALVWSFWHTPLWFVSTAGQPIGFVLNYIFTFIVGNVCMAIIMAICYKRCRNMFIPMWIHFLSNVTLSLVSPFFTDIASIMEGRCWVMLFYVLSTAVFVLWEKIRNKST